VERIAYANGEFVPESEARISVLDHAVLYGDGVFDTVVAWDGRVFKLEAHIERFFKSMVAIRLDPPLTRQRLADLVVEAVRRNALRDAYIKFIMTRGVNGKPLMDPEGCVPNLIILVRPYIQRVPDDGTHPGLRVKTAAIRRPPGQVLDAKVKSLNYLNLVLAKLEAKAAGADEALLLDIDGRVCEAPGFNVFTIHGRKLRTPSRDVLVGITRETIIELAGERGFAVEVGDVELYDAYTADELVFCSTAGGPLPVVELDGRRIGSGRPGPVFAELAAAYKALLASSRYGTEVFPPARRA
jgi:branched-chain amino acid aminotransferase